MLEEHGFYVLALGAVLVVIGYVWLLGRAFKQRILWGLALLLLPPLALPFICIHFRKCRGPVLTLLLGSVVVAIPYGLSYYERHFVPLKPYEQVVDGELRVTLTGLTGFDYSSLQGKPEIVTLQMANEDVDDQTLTYLRGMNQLRRLDLSGTRITDAGLALVAELPRLEELYLARTKVTDEGFQKHLAAKESLVKLDLTGTDLKSKTKREWKKLKPEQRAYVD